MKIETYFTDLDIEHVEFKRLDPDDNYTGRDLILTTHHNWIVFKDARPSGIEHLIQVLQEKLGQHFVKDPNGKWRNRHNATV